MLAVLLLALAAQEPSRTLQPHATGTEAALFTPDGKLLVTLGGPDRSVRVWLVDTGRTLQTLAGKAVALAMGPDGTSVAVGGKETTTLWDPATGALRQTLPTGEILMLGFSRDGKSLTTAAQRSQTAFKGYRMSVWDLKTGRSLKSFDIAVNTSVSARALSSDAARLAFARDERSVRVWDVESEKEIATIPHEDRVAALAFSPDGESLASVSRDGSVRLWDPVSGKERRRLTDSCEKGSQLVFSRDGSVLAVLAGRGVELWDLKGGTRTPVLHKPPSTGVFLGEFVEISPDGGTLLAGGSFVAKDAPKDRKTTGPVFFWKIIR